MAYYFSVLLGHERDGQGAGLAQGIDDELLVVIRVRCGQERRYGYGTNGRNI
jgi:hypothetical protein